MARVSSDRRALAPAGVDAALDVPERILPELIQLAGGRDHVVTIADYAGAKANGVRFSSGDASRATYVLAGIGELIESGRFACRWSALGERPGATDRPNSRSKRGVEPTLGFEPRTCCLRNSCSTAELCRPEHEYR